MDTKTSTAAVLVMAAGLFYRGGSQNTSSSASTTDTGNGTPTIAAASTNVTVSSDFGPWTPVCKYIEITERESAGQSVKLDLKLDGTDGNKNLSGNISLTGSQQKQGDLKEQFCLAAQATTNTNYVDGWRVTALIATVPNPELTHLSLTFDRDVESITWALSDGDLNGERYSFDSYWFPWRTDQKEETDLEKRKAAEKEREKNSNKPGVLLFRRAPQQKPIRSTICRPHPSEKDLLMVFLVGETPTSGINRVAFNQAWTYATTLATTPLPICGSTKACVGILGPSFTGSLPSLRYLLETNGKSGYATFVISGAVTGEDPSTRRLAEGNHFCTTIEDSQQTGTVSSRFLKDLSIWHSDSEIGDHFAVLSEDETDYGTNATQTGTNATQTQDRDPLRLRFPRGIARLRNSSDELPGLVKSPQTSSYPELPLNLRDRGQDTIPSFSPQQSPVSQEAVVIELAAALRRERIRYVGIVATDPLDSLFLTRALHALAPNIRIVLFSADLLFARASQSWGLSGVLAVTSYPLITRNQYFAGAVSPRRTQFASESAEGEYNASRRMLLKSPEANDDQPCSAKNQTPNGDSDKQDYLLDYATPFAQPQDIHKPSVWLTVLGRNEWWPVAAFPSDDRGPLLEGPAPGPHALEQFSVEQNPQPWLLFFWLTWILCASHVGLVFIMNLEHAWYFGRFSPHFRSWWKISLLRRLGWDYTHDLRRRRRGTLAVASLTVACASCSLAVSVYASGLPGWGYVQITVAAVVGAAALAEALWAAWGNTGSRRRTLWFLAVLMTAIAEIAGAWLAANLEPAGHTREFAGYRALHIESGISPVLPIIGLLLAIYLFCWFRLSRLRIAEERYATLPSDKNSDAFPNLAIPGHAVQEMGPRQWAFVVAAVLAWLIFFNPLEALATIEGAFYDAVLGILSSIVVFLYAQVLVRFLVTWRQLLKLLQDLERHPLRYAFSRLPKDFSWTTVWAGDPRPKLIMPARSLDVLRMIPDWQAQHEADEIEHEFQLLKCKDRSYRMLPMRVARLNRILNAAFGHISQHLSHVWRQGVSDSIKSREMEKKDEVPTEWKEDPVLIACEEFLAVRFVSFIAYTLHIMRGFLEFIAYGFILLVIALAVYPFEGKRNIETAVVIIFILAGAAVVVVFAQMDRDPLLSRLSESKPNQLGLDFVYRLVSFGALPLLTLLASQVPDFGNFLLSWLQPALQSLK